MKMKSISGVTCYVNDLAKTIEFYTALGFDFKKQDAKRATGYVNWFWVDFVLISAEEKPEFQKEAQLDNKGAGVFLNISVDDVDAFHAGALEKGLKPASDPRDWPWGNREFVMRDPDGYKLVFFKKK
ncbi:MAG: VOC family protein [Weeksellaceae bacterium]